jgi:hypothetical protein
MRHRTNRALTVATAVMLLVAACGGNDDPATANTQLVDDQIAVSTTEESDATTSSVQTEGATAPTTLMPDFAWELDGDGTAAAGGIELGFVGAYALGEEAVSFDGHTGHAITATPGPLDTTESFTVTAWVNYAAPSEIAAAVSQLADSTGAFQLGIGENSQWWFMMKIQDRTGLEYAAWAEGPMIKPANRWVHLAGVHDHEAGMIRLYVDGDLAGETPFTTPVAATGPMIIGRAQFDGTPGNFWPGAIADVAAYQTALTATQIGELHATTTPAGPPPPRPEPDPSTYADGLLNGTWDYVIPNDSELFEFIVSDFQLTSPEELRMRIGFDDHEWWLGVIADGELQREPGGVPKGDGGTFVIDGDEMIHSNRGGTVTYQWQLDDDQLTLTLLATCNTEHSPPLCIDTREEVIAADPFVPLITEHTYTRSGDDPSY